MSENNEKCPDRFSRGQGNVLKMLFCPAYNNKMFSLQWYEEKQQISAAFGFCFINDLNDPSIDKTVAS